MTELKLNGDEVANRALQLCRPRTPTIWYFLDAEKGTRNGGRDPSAADCATHWKDGNGKPWATADCVALACWSTGIPRKLRRFAKYGGHINTDSMILDAEDTESVFRVALRPRRGCLLVIPSVFDDDTGKRLSPGHVGVVVGVRAPEWPVSTTDATRALGLLDVAHCSPRNHRPYGQAIAVTNGTLWGGRRWRLLELA